jgi:hypothetical protein
MALLDQFGVAHWAATISAVSVTLGLRRKSIQRSDEVLSAIAC